MICFLSLLREAQRRHAMKSSSHSTEWKRARFKIVLSDWVSPLRVDLARRYHKRPLLREYFPISRTILSQTVTEESVSDSGIQRSRVTTTSGFSMNSFGEMKTPRSSTIY